MSYSLNLIEHELSIVKRTYFLNVNQLINNITNQPNNTKNITNLLLVISFSYSLLNLPYLISWCIFYFGELMNRTPLETNQIYSVIKISEIFFLINYSINFYIYCLSGSIFRKQLKYSGKLYLLLTCLDIILIVYLFKLIMENQKLRELKILLSLKNLSSKSLKFNLKMNFIIKFY